MKMARFFLLAAATLTLSTPAIACSVVPDYRVPTNLELVEEAELVLLGRVVGEAKEDGGDPWDSALLVEPIEAIKGETPEGAGAAGTVAIGGVGLVPEERSDFAVLSNPYELAQAHPLSYIGGCIRYMFPAGTTALFFLERDDSGTGWRSAGGPFSRWAEDVLTDDAPWLRLVRLYTRAAALPAAASAPRCSKPNAPASPRSPPTRSPTSWPPTSPASSKARTKPGTRRWTARWRSIGKPPSWPKPWAKRPRRRQTKSTPDRPTRWRMSLSASSRAARPRRNRPDCM